jgi:formate dehydrogenase major subunit
VLPNYRIVSYDTARGCAAAYFPEANVLVPLASTAIGSNTPASKAVIVRLEPVAEGVTAGAGQPTTLER